jgi:hypothetical protein
MRTILLLISIIIPLSAMAEESFISGAYLPYEPLQKHSTKLNLKYEPEFDLDFCETNEVFCQKLDQDRNRSVLPKFEMYKRPKDWQWKLFWTLQTLDVLTTAEGLTYDCISELNPLLGDRPSTLRLVAHKGVIFGSSWSSFTKNTSESDLNVANFITGIAVLNNFDVISDARTYCNKLN